MVTKALKKTVEGQELAERRLAREKRKQNKLTTDNFMNFNLQLGQGTDNALSNSTYGFNPITRYRVLLEWIHRGSWLGGIAIDVAAEDAVRGGIEIHSSMSPKDVEKLQNALVRKAIWKKYTDFKKWARLYGGAIAVYLIDGQDFSTPLNMDTVGKGQFKGLAVFDRWQCQPTLNQEGLVEEFGPDLGLPKYYLINNDAPMLRGKRIHYSRVIRQVGIELPFYQMILEQYWGISVLERLYDRLVAFDSATSGIAQYIHKMHLRVIKIDKYRQIQAAGGKLLQGFMRFAEDMRRRQSNEGITYIDSADDFIVHNSNISSGISEALNQLAQQLSGALQTPLVRMFGQSPGGLGSNGDSELRTYYETVNQHQERDDRIPITNICILTAKSEGIKLNEEEFGFNFRSLYQLNAEEKSSIFDKDSRAILEAFATGVIDKPTALKELRQLGRHTDRWTNITDEEIEDAENEPPMPALEDLTPQLSKLEKIGQKPANNNEKETSPSGKDKKKAKDEMVSALHALNRMSKIIHNETPVLQLFGLPIVIECNEGEARWEGGHGWPSKYGYICNALGTDGDELDCFVGNDLTSTEVFILNHNDTEGYFEELKVMFGFNSIEEALDVYRRAYRREADTYSMTIDLADFNHWLAHTDLTAPVRPSISEVSVKAFDVVLKKNELIFDIETFIKGKTRDELREAIKKCGRIVPKATSRASLEKTLFSLRGRFIDKDWQESAHPRNKEGEFTFKGAGEKGAKKSKSKATKPKAPQKAQLYAKVVELGLEKGQTGKYKKATNAKLMALLAATQGWKPDNPSHLKGLNPFINVNELKEIKAIIEKMQFSSLESVKEKEAEKKAAEKKAAAEKKEASKQAAAEKKVAEKKALEEKKAAEKKAGLKTIAAYKQEANKLGFELSYSASKKTYAEAIEQAKLTDTYHQTGQPLGSFDADNPSYQQQHALKCYTDGLYKKINEALRIKDKSSMSGKVAPLVHYLDEVTLNSNFNEPVYRGISESSLLKISEATGGLKVGAEFGDEGFGSFSKVFGVAKNWKSVLIRVENGGQGLVDIQKLSEHYGEAEVLAARGLRMKIKKWDVSKRELDVEIVGVKNEKLKTKDAAPEERPDDFVEAGPTVPMLERWAQDEEDENFMRG